MRTRHGAFLLATGAGLAAFSAGDRAQALSNSDVSPALPNVLLLVDTSGSMEFMTDPDSTGAAVPPYCHVADAANTGETFSTIPSATASSPNGDQRSKWLSLVEVLTGNFTMFNCASESRTPLPGTSATATTWQTEWKYDAKGQTALQVNPYDYLYFLPHHRFVSQVSTTSSWCAFGPDKSGSNSWLSKVSNASGATAPFWRGDDTDGPTMAPGVRNYVLASAGATRAAGFGIDMTKNEGTSDCLGFTSLPQDTAGLLDQFAYSARFGLMTFDSSTDPATGGSTTATLDGNGGEIGIWSYYNNWDGIGTANCLNSSSGNCNCGGSNYYDCALGKPNGCTLGSTGSGTVVPANEVGARNSAAPPWEGRMIGFGHSDAPTDVVANNRRIQKTLLSMRPYGATPTAGLLQDAETYLTQDIMPDYPSFSLASGTSAESGPCNGAPCFGPAPSKSADPLAACRQTSMILLTDGSPNMDLRPYCDSSGWTGSNPGQCPYRAPEAIAQELSTTSTASSLGLSSAVKTYVVGFAPSSAAANINWPCSVAADCLGTGNSCNATTHKCTLPFLKTISCDVNQASGGQLDTAVFDASTHQCDPTLFDQYGNVKDPKNAGLKVCCDLAKIAYYGGTNTPYYAASANALRVALASILGSVAATETSRTPPIFAPGYPTKSGWAGQFEFNSSFKVVPGVAGMGLPSGALAPPANLWSGVLERQRTACSSTGAPTAQAFANGSGGGTDKGDDFAQNVNSWSASKPRHFFSAYPKADSNGLYHPEWSLRWPARGSSWPTGSAWSSDTPYAGVATTVGDGLGNIDSTSVGAQWYGDSSKSANSSAFLVPNSTSNVLAPLMNVTYTNCAGDLDPTKIGQVGGGIMSTPPSTSAGSDTCAKRMLSWLLGFPQPTTTSATGAGGSLTPPTRTDVFGAIYRSTPVVLGPPTEGLADESYRAWAAGPQSYRPIMLYTQTLDGQLHAFKVDKSPADTGSNATYDYTVDTAVQNEVWSFIPPAVLRAIPSLYPGSQQFVLDGPVIVRDVRLARPVQNSGGQKVNYADPTQTQWGRILVAGFGLGPGVSTISTGGYYAVDVTDWRYPRLLWQLTTDRSGNALFGTGATPVITQLSYTDPEDGDGEYPVAILPGGSALMSTTGTCTLNSTAVGPTNSSYVPRTASGGTATARTKCYNGSDPSRSLTIVRLDTGTIVRTFRPSSAKYGIDSSRVLSTYAPDFPITGTPAVFPSGTGQIATRGFVGDAEGQLWRFDLTSKNPANWTMKVWFDAYNRGVCDATGGANGGLCSARTATGSAITGTITSGQPIQTAPVLSVDRLGNLTVAFSTGDQTDFNSSAGTASAGLFGTAPMNWIWSLREQPNTTTTQTTANWPEVLWYKGFANSERVTGPMALFDSTLYFTTMLPASAAGCSSSSARVYGLDYMQIQPPSGGWGTNTPDPSYGGLARLSDSCGDSYYVDLTCGMSSSTTSYGVSAFGAAVQQTLTCTTTSSTSNTDPLMSFGQHTAVSAVQASAQQYQLVVQTGRGGAPLKNGSTTGGAQTNQKTIAINTPPNTIVRIDSWAEVVE